MCETGVASSSWREQPSSAQPPRLAARIRSPKGSAINPRIAGFLEQLPKPAIAMHIWLALHLAGCPLSRNGNDSVAGAAELLPEQPPAGRGQAREQHLAHQAVPE